MNHHHIQHKKRSKKQPKELLQSSNYNTVLITAILFAVILTAGIIFQRHASADAVTTYTNGFEADTAGWSGSGSISRISSGADGITSATGDYHAIVTGTPGPNTQFGGYGSVWSSDWKATVDIYFDPSWGADSGFIYAVATNNTNSTHLRDFVLNAGVLNDETTGNVNQLVVLADTAGSPTSDPLYHIKAMPVERRGYITEAGWYRVEHNFKNYDGKLIVTVSIIDDSGNTVYSQPIDYEWMNDRIPEDVGGNRYGWFTHINVAGGVAIDNVIRTVSGNVYNVTPDANQAASFNVEAGETVSLSGVSGGSVTAPVAITISNSSAGATINIPAGTKITADPSWDGSFIAPVKQSINTASLPGHIAEVSSAVKVGSDVPLEFSQPVKVVIAGAADKYAGYINHSNRFFDIDTECGVNPSTMLVSGLKECYTTEGDDLVIWTLHFSTFLAYSAVGVPNTGLLKDQQLSLLIGGGVAVVVTFTLVGYGYRRLQVKN
jgi:hypothetical protein